jgi:hypothetical protein
MSDLRATLTRWSDSSAALQTCGPTPGSPAFLILVANSPSGLFDPGPRKDLLQANRLLGGGGTPTPTACTEFATRIKSEGEPGSLGEVWSAGGRMSPPMHLPRPSSSEKSPFVIERVCCESPRHASSVRPQILKKSSRNARIAARSPLSDPPWMRWKQVKTKSLGSNDRVAGVEPGSAGS